MNGIENNRSFGQYRNKKMIPTQSRNNIFLANFEDDSIFCILKQFSIQDQTNGVYLFKYLFL